MVFAFNLYGICYLAGNRSFKFVSFMCIDYKTSAKIAVAPSLMTGHKDKSLPVPREDITDVKQMKFCMMLWATYPVKNHINAAAFC
jgi:hypothetical protein